MTRTHKRTQAIGGDRRGLWFERVMALLALTNLALVFFDLTYISWRDFYFRRVPGLTQLYDPVKGIEPERDTQRLLETVTQLETQVARTGLDSPEAELVLRRVRLYSRRMIEENPFQIANKSGTLAKIKNRMKEHMRQDSSVESITTFWTKPYLNRAGWDTQIAFFNQEIRPLIATNYYRPIGENGDPVDRFWMLDQPFVLLFGLEFLARTYYLSRKRKGVSWLDAMIWRWYDVFLLLPLYRWLRVLPVVLRLDQAELINLDRIRTQFNQSLAASLAAELSEIIVVQAIDQAQGAIKDGEIVNFLFRNQTRRPYQDLNNVNEIEAIGQHVMNLVFYQALPKTQPQIEALLRYSLESALKQLPFYRDFQQVPGLGQIPTQLIERAVNEATKTAYQTLIASLEDPVGNGLTKDLLQQFTTELETQLRDPANLAVIQSLVIDLLEEVKLNYVQQLSSHDTQATLDEARQIRLIHPK